MEDKQVEITLRVPGDWAHPGELIERMPDGFQLTPESLIFPDGQEVSFTPMPPDDQFPQIFANSCRQPPDAEELATVNRYSVNVGLTGPGGSNDSAHAMMQAGAAIIRAGGAGVFNDNSGLAHGGGNWIAMTDDGSPDALSFAFVSIVQGASEVWTMGMHVLGCRDIVMHRSDLDEDGNAIIDIIRYLCSTDKPIDEGHLLADASGLLFQTLDGDKDEFEDGSPMHNPFGRWRLRSTKDIAENN